jgi:hypothetical protein
MNQLRRVIPLSACALLAALAGPAHSQSDADRIRNLEKLVEQLTQKISQIEQASAGAREAQAKVAQQAAKIEAIEKNVSDIGGSLSNRSAGDGLPVHGFADVGLVKNGERNPTFTGRKGAALGTFSLYLTPQFTDRARGLVELAFEADRNGAIATDLERLQLGYLFNDAAIGWLGRFHTPYGYWNTAFHHGLQIQTSTMRPRFLDFEDKGGILPAHTTGVWLNGTFPTATGKLGYDLYAGNAPQINGTGTGTALATAHPAGFSSAVNAGTYAGTGTLSMRQSGSTAGRTSSGFNAWIEPGAVDGLRLGLHGLRGEVIDDFANSTLLKMLGGYYAYSTEKWEALGEYYRFRNQDRSGATGTHASWAGYMQLGYTVGKWTPFARVERARLDQTDNYFGVQESGRSYDRWAMGLRYELDPRAALKTEFTSTRKRDLGPGVTDKYPELRVQYAIGF